MTISERTIRYFLGAALGVAVVLAPAVADADSAVLAEKQNPAVTGVAAGSEAATTAAPTTPAPAQQKPKKKQKTSRFKPAVMMAVPLETVQGTAPAAQAPVPAGAGATGAAPAATAGSPAVSPAAAAAVTAPQQTPPAAAPQQATGASSSPSTQSSPSPAAQAAAQGAPAAPQAAPAAAATAGAAAAAGTTAGTPAGTAVETAAETPAPSKHRLGMWTTSSAAKVPAPSGDAPAIVRKDIIGIVPPLGRITGHVLGKDGITMLGGAELVLDHQVFGSEHRIMTDASGGFDIELPIGQYDLTIQRRHEIYESPTTYSIAGRRILPVDFILLRDFEEQPAPAPTGKGSTAGGDVSKQNGVAVDETDRWLPDPRREPEVVGSVVDLVSPDQEEASGHPRKHGTETMGFLGALLVVLIAL